MKRRYVSIICVLVLLLIVSTACGKKDNEQSTIKNILTVEDEVMEKNSDENMDSEVLLDKQIVTEEWESEEEIVQEQGENDSEENGEEITEQDEKVLSDNESDSNTLKELSDVPFA